MSRPGLVERARRAWAVFTDDPGWLVIENMEPVGWKVIEEFDTADEALEWRAANTPGERFLVMDEAEWRDLTLALVQSERYWRAWGLLLRRANLAAERAAERHAEQFVLLADHDPLYSTGPIEMQADTIRAPGDRLERARRRADRLPLNENPVPGPRAGGDSVGGP